MNNFGEFLYSLRKDKGLTQAELAQALGVTNKAVSKWETGEAMPETSLLLPLSRIFGVTVDELLAGKHRNTDDYAEDEDEGDGDYERFDPQKHLFTRGKDEEKTVLDIVGGAVCLSVMMLSIAAYLIIGTFLGLWHPYWLIIPVSALSCGIIGIIFDLINKKKRDEKVRRGENPITGSICGIVMLSSIIAYLFVGALTNLWHPYWIIVVMGALVCAVAGAIGDIILKVKNK